MLHTKMSKTDYIVEFILMFFGVCLCIIILCPLLNIVAVSFSSTSHVLQGDIGLIPKGFTTKAYEMVLTNKEILRATANSIYLVVVDCVAKIAAVYLTAYPLAYCDFPGKKIWTKIILVAMWLSAGTIPYFLCMKNMGLYDTYWPLVLAGLVNPFHVIIVRNFMEGISKSLIDAARIDGASEFKTMLRVVMPLSKPIIATLTIWYVAATWSRYMGPTIYLSSPEKFVLQQVLRSIVLESDLGAYDMTFTSVNDDLTHQIRYAVLVVSTIPMFIMYPFAQKHFTKGVMLGGVKE